MPSVGKQEGAKYDCGFLDASGNFLGLMLVKDKNGAAKYAESNDPGLARQYFTGQAGYTNFEPQKKIQIGQSDYRAGFGQEYYDSGSPKRYYYGTDIDTRFKDMVIAGPKATAITMPSATMVVASAALTNGDMETAASGWSVTYSGATTATFARSNDVVKNGTYCYKLLCNAEASGTAYGYQDISWDAAFQGKTAYFWAWVYANSADKTYLRIDDGVGTTDSTVVAADAQWHLVTVSRTLDASATRCRVGLYISNNTGNIAAYIDDARTIVASAPTASCEFNDNLYIGIGNTLYKLNTSTGNTLTFIGVFMSSITRLEAFTDDKLYIALGASNKYYYMSTAEALTESDSTAYFFKTKGTTMYKVLLPRSVYTATAPTTDGGWSAATTIGSTAENITAITEITGTPYIGKEDVPHYLTTAGADTVLAPDLISEKASTSGLNMHVWQGKLYYPCGNQALYEYNPVTEVLTDISPSKYITNAGDYDGRVMALASDSQYLFAFIDNDTKVEMLAGRYETVDGVTAWAWHGSLSSLTLTGAQFALASTVYARRLWLFSTAAADSIYYYPLPSQYGNITADSTYSFQTGGSIITPYHHCEFKADSKAWYNMALTMSGTTANIYWRAYYEKLGDSSWTEINSTDKFKTSPVTSANLPVDGSSNKPQSTMMRFKFEQVTNVTTTTPVLLNYNAKAIWYPRHEQYIVCQVYAKDRCFLRNGQEDEEQSAATIMTAVNAWNNPTVAWARAFYPPYYFAAADLVYAKLMPPEGVPFLSQIYDDKTGNIEWVYNLNLLVVNGLSF